MDEKQLQRKYLEFQAIDQQMQMIQKQLQQFEENLAEIDSIKQSLDELKVVKPGTEILVPVSQGLFVKAAIRNSDELIVNVGGGAAVTKDINGAKKLLDEQMMELDKSREELVGAMQDVMAKAKLLENEIAKIVEKK